MSKTFVTGEVLTASDVNEFLVNPEVRLVAVKSAIFTGVQTNSTAAGANFAVTDLSITHALADAANKLIISFFGLLSPSQTRDSVGAAVFDGTNFLSVGAAAGTRTRVTNGGGRLDSVSSNYPGAVPVSFFFVHSPATTASITYTAHIFNLSGGTRAVSVNKSTQDDNGQTSPRGASSLVIQEVKV